MDEYSKINGFSPAVVTGKPLDLHGSEGREAATGRGIVFSIENVLTDHKMKIEGSKFVIQGFGNVGSFAAQILQEQGGVVVAVSDISGGIYSPEGLDIKELVKATRQGQLLNDMSGYESITNEELLVLPCDVLVPAALGRCINENNANDIQARFIVEAANSPVTPRADEILGTKNILVVPDILANAGGVTVSYFEWTQNIQQFRWSEADINMRLKLKMRKAYQTVAKVAKKHHVDFRTAAFIISIGRVGKATVLSGI